MSIDSQNRLIAAHLQRPGASITPLVALRLYGAERLAARIYDLKKAGMAIDRRMVRVVGAHGPARVAEYVLAGGGV